MSAAIRIRQDFEAATLRRLATTAKDAGQARRLLALAAVYDGTDREAAARIGGMDRRGGWISDDRQDDARGARRRASCDDVRPKIGSGSRRARSRRLPQVAPWAGCVFLGRGSAS